MKKIIIYTSILVFSLANIQAQKIANNAIGLRIGDADGFGTEINYQRAIFDTNRLEIGLGWQDGNGFNAFKLSGFYEWVWLLDGSFNWYAGVGAGIGTFSLDDDFPGGNDVDEFFVNAAGTIGIEYSFDFPLLLSLDFRPEIGLLNDVDDDLEFEIALGIRYQFN